MDFILSEKFIYGLFLFTFVLILIGIRITIRRNRRRQQFFDAVYMNRNLNNFADMDPRQQKRVLSDMLRLDKLES